MKFAFARLALQSICSSNVLLLIEQQVLKRSIVFATECIHGEKCHLLFSQIGILARSYGGFRLLLFSAVSCKLGNFKEGEKSYWKHRNIRVLWQLSSLKNVEKWQDYHVQFVSVQPVQPYLGTRLWEKLPAGALDDDNESYVWAMSDERRANIWTNWRENR